MRESNFKLNRVLASLVDGLIMFLITAGICTAPAIIFFKGLINNNFIIADLFWLLFSIFGSFAVWILYLFISALLFKGSTLGMKFYRLTFIRTNGTELRAMNIFFREATMVICIILSLGFSVIFDFLSMLCNDSGKNFYDIFSSTKVVTIDE